MIADVFLKFTLEPHYADNYVEIIMNEHTKRKGDRWPQIRLIMRRKVKISGLFKTKSSLGFRLSRAQREMISEYKRNIRYYDAIDQYCEWAHTPNVVVQDSRTSEVLSRYT